MQGRCANLAFQLADNAGTRRDAMSKTSKDEPPKDKEAELNVRLDPELKQKLQDKARSRGWTLGAVARALFRLWLEEDLISPEDVGEEQKRAPFKQPRKKKDKPAAK